MIESDDEEPNAEKEEIHVKLRSAVPCRSSVTKSLSFRRRFAEPIGREGNLCWVCKMSGGLVTGQPSELRSVSGRKWS